MDVSARKDALRRLTLSRRGRLSPGSRIDLAQVITERLLGLPELAGGGPVLAFVSMASEVPTSMLLEVVTNAGRTLLLPYVSEDGALRAAAVGSLEELTPGYRGIPEPRARMPVSAESAEAIVTPGVAFDARGGRLGYGGGFYDAFLRAAPQVARIGICFEVQVVDEVPMAPHDELVDVVVTEERILRPENARNRT